MCKMVVDTYGIWYNTNCNFNYLLCLVSINALLSTSVYCAVLYYYYYYYFNIHFTHGTLHSLYTTILYNYPFSSLMLFFLVWCIG